MAGNLWQRQHPSKLFVEVTTRCHIECAMCVKQSDGCLIDDGDMSDDTFLALEPALRRARTLILNGVGEPLLHPRLVEFTARAREWMPPGADIGFQTNGQLLTPERLEDLADAGLSVISFSLDAADPALFADVRRGGELKGIGESLDFCRDLRRRRPEIRLKVGIEAVLQASTMEGLPDTLAWAADRGADFALVSHLLAYDESGRSDAVFDRCTDAALEHYRTWEGAARRQGLDLQDYYSVRWKFHHDPEQMRLIRFVDAMVADATEKGIFFHLPHLLDRDPDRQRRLDEVMNRCRRVAREKHLELELPAAAPSAERRCDFIEEGGMFVSMEGNVHPCYFLWHSYSCFVTEWRKYVTARVFGNVNHQPVLDIWNSAAYREFRDTAAGYDYPFCTNCSFAPCDYIDSQTFEQDCYTNTIPCGDCQWCLGLFRCLG